MSFDLKIINGDFSKNSNGSLDVVKDNEKLIQAILKICLTEVGSNPLHGWYGSYLSKSIVGTVLNSEITDSMIKSQLQTAIELLKEIQDLQYYSNQTVSSQEMIHSILKIDVTRDNSDYRLYKILIIVLTKGLKPAKAGFAIVS